MAFFKNSIHSDPKTPPRGEGKIRAHETRRKPRLRALKFTRSRFSYISAIPTPQIILTYFESEPPPRGGKMKFHEKAEFIFNTRLPYGVFQKFYSFGSENPSAWLRERDKFYGGFSTPQIILTYFESEPLSRGGSVAR